MNIKEKIQEKSGVILNDFPKQDFNRIEALLKEHNKIEVWLEKGMGRYHLRGSKVGEHKSAMPFQEKMCELKLSIKLNTKL